MLTVRKSADRGYADHGWLKSFHSFSFAGYYDPAHMGWGNLRVINEDRIAPGTGFGAHGHRDMEIISYVISGEHSEFNHAPNAQTHFFQIWIEPNVKGIEPGYEQKTIAAAQKQGILRLVASPDGADGSVLIHADARMYSGLFDGAQTATMAMDSSRKAYVHLVRGRISVNGTQLAAGDAAMLEHESQLRMDGADTAEVLVFDLQA
jgi:redox-sensitive bicupin YhaK (pirin superfamily)